MEKRESGNGEKRGGAKRKEARVTSELPEPGRLARLELLEMRPVSTHQPGKVHCSHRCCPLALGLIPNPRSISSFHAPPSAPTRPTPKTPEKKRKTETKPPNSKHPPPHPLLIPSPPPPHPPTAAAPAPATPSTSTKETNPSFHPDSKSQAARRKRRKETGNITYGLTLIRFSSAPSWSGMMISHSVFSFPASSPSLSRPVAFVVEVVDIWR